jgi:hypothetical protein
MHGMEAHAPFHTFVFAIGRVALLRLQLSLAPHDFHLYSRYTIKIPPASMIGSVRLYNGLLMGPPNTVGHEAGQPSGNTSYLLYQIAGTRASSAARSLIEQQHAAVVSESFASISSRHELSLTHVPALDD